VAPSFISARYSGKLRRHKARRDCIASLSSFLSVAVSGPRRDRRSSQWFCSESRPSKAERARKVYRCRDLFTSVTRAANIELKSLRMGVSSVPNAEATSAALDSGLSS
jgi:hypothetical protein